MNRYLLSAAAVLPWQQDLSIPTWVVWSLVGIVLWLALFLAWMWYANRLLAQEQGDEFKDQGH